MKRHAHLVAPRDVFVVLDRRLPLNLKIIERRAAVAGFVELRRDRAVENALDVAA